MFSTLHLLLPRAVVVVEELLLFLLAGCDHHTTTTNPFLKQVGHSHPARLLRLQILCLQSILQSGGGGWPLLLGVRYYYCSSPCKHTWHYHRQQKTHPKKHQCCDTHTHFDDTAKDEREQQNPRRNRRKKRMPIPMPRPRLADSSMPMSSRALFQPACKYWNPSYSSSGTEMFGDKSLAPARARTAWLRKEKSSSSSSIRVRGNAEAWQLLCRFMASLYEGPLSSGLMRIAGPSVRLLLHNTSIRGLVRKLRSKQKPTMLLLQQWWWWRWWWGWWWWWFFSGSGVCSPNELIWEEDDVAATTVATLHEQQIPLSLFLNFFFFYNSISCNRSLNRFWVLRNIAPNVEGKIGKLINRPFSTTAAAAAKTQILLAFLSPLQEANCSLRLLPPSGRRWLVFLHIYLWFRCFFCLAEPTYLFVSICWRWFAEEPNGSAAIGLALIASIYCSDSTKILQHTDIARYMSPAHEFTSCSSNMQFSFSGSKQFECKKACIHQIHCQKAFYTLELGDDEPATAGAQRLITMWVWEAWRHQIHSKVLYRHWRTGWWGSHGGAQEFLQSEAEKLQYINC